MAWGGSAPLDDAPPLNSRPWRRAAQPSRRHAPLLSPVAMVGGGSGTAARRRRIQSAVAPFPLLPPGSRFNSGNAPLRAMRWRRRDGAPPPASPPADLRRKRPDPTSWWLERPFSTPPRADLHHSATAARQHSDGLLRASSMGSVGLVDGLALLIFYFNRGGHPKYLGKDLL